MTKLLKLTDLSSSILSNELPLDMVFKNATHWDVRKVSDTEILVKLSIYGVIIIKTIFDIKTQKLTESVEEFDKSPVFIELIDRLKKKYGNI